MDAEREYPWFELRPHDNVLPREGVRELVIHHSSGQASTWPGLRDQDVAALWEMLTMSNTWAWSTVPEILLARAEVRRRCRLLRHPDPGPNCLVCGGTLPHCQVDGACRYLDMGPEPECYRE